MKLNRVSMEVIQCGSTILAEMSDGTLESFVCYKNLDAYDLRCLKFNTVTDIREACRSWNTGVRLEAKARDIAFKRATLGYDYLQRGYR